MARHRDKLHPVDVKPHSVVGFTLLEIVVALTLGALVILIASSALSGAMRLWSRGARPPDAVARHMELLKEQLACQLELKTQPDGRRVRFWRMTPEEIAFVTSKPVAALHEGAVVLVRHIFDRSDGRLYYAEIPFNFTHPEIMTQFMEEAAQGDGGGIFHVVASCAGQFEMQRRDNGNAADGEQEQTDRNSGLLIVLNEPDAGRYWINSTDILNFSSLQLDAY